MQECILFNKYLVKYVYGLYPFLADAPSYFIIFATKFLMSCFFGTLCKLHV